MKNITSVRFLSTASLVGLGVFALAQFGNVEYAKVTAFAPHYSRAGHVVTTRVAVTVPEGYHIYSPHFTGTGVPTSISLSAAPRGFKLDGTSAPKGNLLKGKVLFQPKVYIPKGVHGTEHFTFSVRFQQCNDKICLPPKTVEVSAHTTVR